TPTPNLSPSDEKGASANVGLKTPTRPATARTAADNDRCVAPLAGTALGPSIEASFRENGRPNTRADERDDGIPRTVAGAEPHLGLAHRLGTVVHVHWHAQSRAQHA